MQVTIEEVVLVVHRFLSDSSEVGICIVPNGILFPKRSKRRTEITASRSGNDAKAANCIRHHIPANCCAGVLRLSSSRKRNKGSRYGLPVHDCELGSSTVDVLGVHSCDLFLNHSTEGVIDQMNARVYVGWSTVCVPRVRMERVIGELAFCVVARADESVAVVRSAVSRLP